jgi:23S rRNA pseudouridine2605 synthase
MSKTNDPNSTPKRPDSDSASPLKRKRVAGVAKTTKAPAADDMQGERIAKAMARAGLCSRREAETWIADGRVSVNGKVLDTPAVTVSAKDRVVVDNQPLPLKERTRLFLYHKPRGLVTTTHDPEGRPTVFERLPEDMPRVVTVGRLDINTEGLLLLTNDGGLARVLELPATGWLRRYRVRAFGTIEQAQLDGLKDGVTIEGISYGPVEAVIDTVTGSNVWMVVGLREGKNREVKRILQHLGLTVNRLIRVSFGPFQLADLGEGEIREIRGKVLRDQLGKRLVDESGADFDAPIVHHIAGAENEGAKPAPSSTPTRAGGRAGGDDKSKRPARTRLEFIGTDEDGSRRARIDRDGKPSVAVKFLPKSRDAERGPAKRTGRPARAEVTDRGPREERGERGAKPFRSEGFRDKAPARGRGRPAEGATSGTGERTWRSEGARDQTATASPRPPRREAAQSTASDAVRKPRGERPFGGKTSGDARDGRPARAPRARSETSEGTGTRGPSRERGTREPRAPREGREPREGQAPRAPREARADGPRSARGGPVRSGVGRSDASKPGPSKSGPPRSGPARSGPQKGGDRSGPHGGGGKGGGRGGNGADRRR